jgi:hypothetical protein
MDLMYASPDETLAALERVGYFTDQKTATTVYLAGRNIWQGKLFISCNE